MLKVFLVEDESVVREALRDNIPWEEYGFTFAGEASDGEMALPMIRSVQPDVLITDIRMPFMDGLQLCHVAGKEFPHMKMIILSGFDDFDYAQRAISEGVDQYLLKPVTRKSMRQALEKVRAKIESEKEQRAYLEKYQQESREMEELQRRAFLEKVFLGNLRVDQIFEEAAKLSFDTNAACYNLLLFGIHEPGHIRTDKRSEAYESAEGQLLSYFLRYPEYMLTDWNLDTWCVIVKGDADVVRDWTDRGVKTIRRVCEEEKDLDWYVAPGEPVDRFSALQSCFVEVNHAFSCRFFRPKEHVLTKEVTEGFFEEGGESLRDVDAAGVDPDTIRAFLETGQKDEIPDFLQGSLSGLADALRSKMFRNYLVLTFRFTAIESVKKLGADKDEAKRVLHLDNETLDVPPDGVAEYVSGILAAAIDYREEKASGTGNRILKEAKQYIDAHYQDEDLSLNSVAEQAGVSGSYFSALFSKEQGITFVEYLTNLRMNKAKELLATTDKHTSQIAAEVGYKDPHYFSFVFRKRCGVTPKEFRAQNAKKEN